MKRLLRISVSALFFLLLTALTFPDEGMWMLTQLDKLPWPEMQKHGLELTPEQIYNPSGPSLKDAVILLGGGTASFISADGLILTNHHVAFGAIQSLSSVQEDYLKNGFIASKHEDELSVPSYSARIVVEQRDVTDSVLAAVRDTMSPESRAKAIQQQSRAIEKNARGTGDVECAVSEFYNGLKYYLFTYKVLRDIRLVYAPPTAIGNYGGEVDNWYWPRHTGDFSIMRAYVAPDGSPARYSKDNVPYKPRVFLPLSTKGYREGSFAMILGFPGRTFRYRTAAEIKLAREETLPTAIDFLKTRMDVIEAAGKNDRAVEIKYASKWRGLANTYKNYQGVLEGMRRSDILGVRQAEEQKFQTFLNSQPALQKSDGNLLEEIASLHQDLRSYNRKQIAIGQLYSGCDMLGVAQRFRNLAESFTRNDAGDWKPDTSAVKSLKQILPNAFKNTDKALDKNLLTALILKCADLPYDQSIQEVQRIVGPRLGEQREKPAREFVDELYDDSKLTSLDGCLAMLDRSADDIRDDPFVKFAAALDRDFAPLQRRAAEFNSKISDLRSRLLDAWLKWKGPDLYPDANRTLRLTYGKIESYDPRDAVHYNYATTLTGVMEKETGADPFIVPPKLRTLWEKKDFGPYADSTLHDVPVAFIADLDITGGNSGSPVLNGKGELIGIAFDGNWEAVVGDYLFQESLNRAISVDARYVLFVLDKYSNAQNVLSELVVH